jgi:hypothetical protein
MLPSTAPSSTRDRCQDGARRYCVSVDPTVSRRTSPKSLQGRNATGRSCPHRRLPRDPAHRAQIRPAHGGRLSLAAQRRLAPPRPGEAVGARDHRSGDRRLRRPLGPARRARPPIGHESRCRGRDRSRSRSHDRRFRRRGVRAAVHPDCEHRPARSAGLRPIAAQASRQLRWRACYFRAARLVKQDLLERGPGPAASLVRARLRRAYRAACPGLAGAAAIERDSTTDGPAWRSCAGTSAPAPAFSTCCAPSRTPRFT